MIPIDKIWCYYCFERLQNPIRKDNQNIVSDRMFKYDKIHYPLFVQFIVDNELRGKVGCYNNIQIVNGLSEYSIAAGMKDFRFSPISKNELQKLTCIVTVLYDFEPINDLQNWNKEISGLLMKYRGSTISIFPSEIKGEISNESIFSNLVKKIGCAIDHPIEQIEMKQFKTMSVSANWFEYIEYINSNS